MTSAFGCFPCVVCGFSITFFSLLQDLGVSGCALLSDLYHGA